MVSIAARLEQLSTPIWIAVAILGFVLWWPLGLAILAYILWSGRMKCCQFDYGRPNERSDDVDGDQAWLRRPRTSGNRAFDEYRAETLRRLEDEHRAFQEYLDRLRMAKDRAEFDEFMAERGAKPRPGSQGNA
jgi:hypothetical protein